MVGGPGSGKSKVYPLALNELGQEPSTFVNIDPDIIAAKLYNDDPKCRPQANRVNDLKYKKVVENNKSLVFNGTGKDFDWYLTNVIQKLKTSGYNVYLCIVMANLLVATDRMKQREKEDGRNVPPDFAGYVYFQLGISIPKYLELDCTQIDGILVYDNSAETTTPIPLIYKRMCEEGKITDYKCAIKNSEPDKETGIFEYEEKYQLVGDSLCPEIVRERSYKRIA